MGLRVWNKGSPSTGAISLAPNSQGLENYLRIVTVRSTHAATGEVEHEFLGQEAQLWGPPGMALPRPQSVLHRGYISDKASCTLIHLSGQLMLVSRRWCSGFCA